MKCNVLWHFYEGGISKNLVGFLEVSRCFKVASPVEYADKVQCYDISKRHPAFRATLVIIQSEVLFSGRNFKKAMDKIINCAIDLFNNPVIEQVYDLNRAICASWIIVF